MPDSYGRPTRKEIAATAIVRLDGVWGSLWEHFPGDANRVQFAIRSALDSGADRREVIDTLLRERRQ